jgi:hypothetical protein
VRILPPHTAFIQRRRISDAESARLNQGSASPGVLRAITFGTAGGLDVRLLETAKLIVAQPVVTVPVEVTHLVPGDSPVVLPR